MGKFIDLTGRRFGRLTVLARAENHKKDVMWRCLCDCGNEITTARSSLLAGRTRSCGCLARESSARIIKKVNDDGATNHNWKHGLSRTRLYRVWTDIKSRCINSSVPEFKWYGGRGIKICDEWKDSFSKFKDWAVSNGYADNLTIDRIDNDGNYCPENCRWATMKEQCRNRSSNRVFEGKTFIEWEEQLGVKPGTIAGRIHKGWSIQQAVSTPKCEHRGKRYRFTTPQSKPSNEGVK